MLLECVLLDALLVSSTVSLALCADGANAGESVAYISELIVQCKRSGATSFVPWTCVAAFAGVMCVQVRWMEQVSAAWLRASAATESREHTSPVFVLCVAGAVAGFGCVVYFDCNGSSDEVVGHRAGVAALSLGTFAALHLVWGNLRAAANNERLQDAATAKEKADEGLAAVPCRTWVEYDVVWVTVLAAFIATGLLETDYVASVWCEYVAFVMLFVQTNWLFLVCVEREHRQPVGAVTGTGFSFEKLLAVVLAAYGVEALLVFMAALLARK